MKKITITYSKALQKLIKDNESVLYGIKWCELPLIKYVHGLIAHVHQIAVTGKVSQPLVPVVTPGHHYLLLDKDLVQTPNPIDCLHQTYHLSYRMEIQVFSGQVDVCLGVNFLFYKAGKGNVPDLILEGAVDSDGIRYLRIKE